jgi:hypothetical protein
MVKLKEKRENKYITLSLIFKKLSLILLLIILIPEKKGEYYGKNH